MKVISGGFQNGNGTSVANGRMFLKLSQDASVIGGPQITGNELISFQLDANGQLPANTEIWYNDELTPAGTAYSVSVLEAGGGLVYGPEYFIFAGASPSNVDNMFPSTYGGSVPVFSAAVLQNPAAAQSITGFPLSIGNTTIDGNTGLITKYNSITLVGNGVGSEIARVASTGLSAAVTTTNLNTTTLAAGQYSVLWNAKKTTADGVSSTLGALTIVYTDPDGVVVTLTAAGIISAGTVATTNAVDSTTSTGVLIGIPMMLNCKASTNITYAMAYASNTPGNMKYNLNIYLVSL